MKTVPPYMFTRANDQTNVLIEYVPEPKEDGLVKALKDAMREGADCETFAFHKADWLNRLGYKARIIFVLVRKTKQAHALCEAIHEGTSWILDNRLKSVITKEKAEKEYDFSRFNSTNENNWKRSWEDLKKEYLEGKKKKD